jgi:alpha-acetolactate decarboxylase
MTYEYLKVPQLQPRKGLREMVRNSEEAVNAKLSSDAVGFLSPQHFHPLSKSGWLFVFQ